MRSPFRKRGGGGAESGQPRSRASLTEGAAFGALSFAFTATLAIGSSILVARLYGVDVVGEYALAYAPVGVVWTLSTLREQSALIRNLAMLDARTPRVTALFFTTLGFSSALTVVVALGASGVTYLLLNGPIGQPHLFWPSVVCLAGYALFTNPCWNLDSVFAAFRAGRDLFWVRIHQAALFLVYVIAGSFVADSVWPLVLATVFSWFTPVIHRVWLVRPWMRFRISWHELRGGFSELPEMLRFGIKLTPGGIAQGLSDQAGTWVLGVVSTVSAVGAYNRAWMLAIRFQELNQRLTELLFPTLVERREQGDHAGFDRALGDALRYIAGLMTVPAAVGGGCAVGIMAIYGAGFARGADALALALLVPVGAGLVSATYQALMAVDRPLIASASFAARLAVTLGAGVALSSAMGITGMALAMVLGVVVQFFWQLALIKPALASPLRALWPPRQVLSLIVAYVAGFASSRVTVDVLPGLGLGLPAGLFVGAVVTASCLLVVGGLLPRDRARLADVVRKASRARIDLDVPGSRLGRICDWLTIGTPQGEEAGAVAVTSGGRA